MSLASMPEAARPAAETPVTLADACSRWPTAFSECLTRLHPAPPRHASTFAHRGVRYLALWADHPAVPDMEIAATRRLPPEIAEVRSLLNAISCPAPTGATVD